MKVGVSRYKVKSPGLLNFGRVGILERVDRGLLILRFKDDSLATYHPNTVEQVWAHSELGKALEEV